MKVFRPYYPQGAQQKLNWSGAETGNYYPGANCSYNSDDVRSTVYLHALLNGNVKITVGPVLIVRI